MNTFPVTTRMSRAQACYFFENNFGVAQRPGTLLSVCLPPFTPQVVNEIAMAKAIPRTSDVKVLDAFRELEDAKDDVLPISLFLLNDVTEAAYGRH